MKRVSTILDNKNLLGFSHSTATEYAQTVTGTAAGSSVVTQAKVGIKIQPSLLSAKVGSKGPP